MGRGLRLCVLYFFFLASLGGWGGKHSGGKKYPGSDSGIRSESKVGRGRGKQGELDEEMGG